MKKKNVMVALGCLALAAAAHAAPVSMANLSGGGATWQNIGSTGLGFGVADAQTGSQGDAFDIGMTFQVNGVAYNTPGGTFDLTGQKVTGGVATLSGLNVHTSYWSDTSSPTLRTLFTLSNTTGSAISATVSMLTNVGSDGSTQHVRTSSGDAVFTATDRWLVSDDSSTTAGDPANLHALWGVGGLAPTAIGTTVFEAAGNQGVRVDYLLTLAAGQTSSLMMLNQIWGTSTAAIGSAAQFDTLSASSSVLADLSAADRNRIVNWRVGSATVPEPGSLLLVGAACLALGAARRRKA